MKALKLWLLYATVFTLPMYMRVNNILLGAFILAGIADNFSHLRYRDIKDTLIRALPVLAFFFLAVLGAFRTFSPDGFSYLEKYWSFLLLPLAMLPDMRTFADKERTVFLALVWGCTATLLICNVNVVYEMITRNEPASYFFRWRHLGHQFTEVADTHPTYLALFIVTSVCFLVQDRNSSYALKSILIPVMVLSLFQLASRMALIILLLLLLFMLAEQISKRQWQLAAIVFGLVFGGLLVFYYGSEYLTSRFFSEEAITNDRRIDRWEVSYEIFREHPVIGVGYEEVKTLRKEGYERHGFVQAASEDYNAHNQFLEYLSTQGVVGGFVYGVSMMYLFFLALNRSNFLFSFMFLAFLIANLSESMLVRIKGIEYLAIFGSLFLCIARSTEDEDFYNARL